MCAAVLTLSSPNPPSPASPLLPLFCPACTSAAADYTNTFRSLSSVGVESGGNGAVGGLPAALAEALGPLEVGGWLGGQLAGWVAGWLAAGSVSASIVPGLEAFLAGILAKWVGAWVLLPVCAHPPNRTEESFPAGGAVRRLARVAGLVPRHSGGRGPSSRGASGHAGTAQGSERAHPATDRQSTFSPVYPLAGQWAVRQQCCRPAACQLLPAEMHHIRGGSIPPASC
jgi:predicted lipid-binding transport protein (Tim44 family)